VAQQVALLIEFHDRRRFLQHVPSARRRRLDLSSESERWMIQM
jgi:hypothetical protein